MLQKIILIVAFSMITGFARGAEDASPTNMQRTAILECADGNLTLSATQWNALKHASRTLSDMFGALGEQGGDTTLIKYLLSSITMATMTMLIQLIESSDQQNGLLALGTDELLNVSRAAVILEIPSLVTTIKKIITEQLQNPKSQLRIEFKNDPEQTINKLNDGEIKVGGNADLAFTLIKPHLQELWRPVGFIPLHFTYFDEDEDTPERVKWSPESTLLATLTDKGDAQVWDKKGNLLRTLSNPAGIVALQWNPNGTVLAAKSKENQVCLWDATGNLLRVLPGPRKTAPHQPADRDNVLAWSPDGALLASSSWDKKLCIWDTTGKLLRSFTLQTEPSLLRWSPDSTLLAVVVPKTITRLVFIWDRANQSSLVPYEIANSGITYNRKVAWSPNSAMLATVTLDDDQPPIILSRTGEQLLTLPERSNQINQLSWSPDSAMLATGLYNSDTTDVWDPKTGKRLFTLSGCVAKWSPDGTLVATEGPQNYKRTINVYNNSGNLLYTVPGFGAAWSPNGAMLAITYDMNEEGYEGWDADNIVNIYDAKGKLLTTIFGSDLAWSPDSTMLITSPGKRNRDENATSMMESDNLNIWDMNQIRFFSHLNLLDALILLTLLDDPQWLNNPTPELDEMILRLWAAAASLTSTEPFTAQMFFSAILKREQDEASFPPRSRNKKRAGSPLSKDSPDKKRPTPPSSQDSP